jgi:CRP-like cAMP-binding protein
MTRHYAAGDVISHEGAVDFGWYILRSGRVGVFKERLQIETFDEPGMVFGELSGILLRPRTAALVALDACELLYVTAGIDDLVVHHPAVAKKIIIMLAERLAKTTDDLWMKTRGER